MSGQDILIYLNVNAVESTAGSWGDTQFAEGLARSIRAIEGCDAKLLFRGEAPETDRARAAVLRIVGPHLEEPIAGMPNLLWVISPPNLAPLPMLARYQAVFCGARLLTQHLVSEGLPARFLPQATETGHFHPSRRIPHLPEIRLLFVGAHADRANRHIVLNAVASGFEPLIWGPGWSGVVPDRLWQGERLGYDGLAETYARSRVILNSHMVDMSRQGFMSNRSYDALASGAITVSDMVTGFEDPDFPEIRQVSDQAELETTLAGILAAPPLGPEERLALHDRVAARHGFDTRAAIIVETARQLLDGDHRATTAFRPRRGAAHVSPPRLCDPAASTGTTNMALRTAAAQIMEIANWLEGTDLPALVPPPPAADQGIIHLLMADLREIQQIACSGNAELPVARLEALAGRARRVCEFLDPDTGLPAKRFPRNQQDQLMARIISNAPLWLHAPDDFSRDRGKASLHLWPRRQPPSSASVPGVFLHLYYDDLAPVFAARLRHIEVPFRLYVSTDTEEKARRIRDSLPDAEIRVLENRGRDIWPKLYGFADAYGQHEVVLHLHGKKSPHAGQLDDWLTHILDCLIGSPGEVNRILSFFSTIPQLGMVAPITFRKLLGAAHWGANVDIARELAWRMGLRDPLPADQELRFPVGSMFWARTKAIRPLLDLNLKSGHFPPEANQIDGTLAHAIERMLGVTCRATGHHLLPVSGAGTRLHVRFRTRHGSNRDVRDALENGDFDA